jgi:hypothetical protein
MNAKFAALCFLAAALVATSFPAAAHHGVAAYDMAHRVTIKGTIVSFDWTNPHCQVHLDVTGEQGNIVHWNFETQPPSILGHAGWTRNSLKPGDRVTIVAAQAKNGEPIGLLQKVVLADGQELTPDEK